MMTSTRSKLLIATCTLLCIAALSGCDPKSSESNADASEPTDISSTDSGSSEKAEAAPQSEDQSGSARPSATSPNGAEVALEPPLEIAGMLQSEDLKALNAGEISSEKLAGKAATPTYNSVRLFPKKGSSYGVGMQVWKFEDDSKAVDFVAHMRPQYLGVEDAPADAPTPGERAFVASRAGIQNYVFAPKDGAHHVFALSCSDDFCKGGWSDLKTLASTVEKRVIGEKVEPKKELKKDAKKAAKK
ncbi:hypothetical protein [Bradymonas sediminis]|nr:hypothetical protein [Bradymonas sediminis]